MESSEVNFAARTLLNCSAALLLASLVFPHDMCVLRVGHRDDGVSVTSFEDDLRSSRLYSTRLISGL